jgi:uncharacterized protein YndB with AHSA1/START domain
MEKKQIRKAYFIQAPVEKVWKALTTPEIIRQYYFGTHAVSDWKKGSIIDYTGEWQGKPYHDKGIIREIVPGKMMTISHWSDRSGKPDIPENYSDHSYYLEPANHGTQLTISQDDQFKTEESRNQAWKHWDMVMEGLRKVVVR